MPAGADTTTTGAARRPCTMVTACRKAAPSPSDAPPNLCTSMTVFFALIRRAKRYRMR